MSVSIKLKGVPRVRRFLSFKKNQINILSNIGLTKAAIFVQGEVKTSIARGKNAPVAVDTGQFLSSVDFSVKKDSAIVFSNVPHAPPVEFGTSRMRARPHFRNTAFKEKQSVRMIINREIKKV